MTYSTDESSVAASRPVELFEFTVGDQVFRYSSAEDIELEGLAYVARSIFREKVVYGQVGSGTLTVTMPAADELPVLFGSTTPSKVSRCKVTRYQRASGESVVIYRGVIASVDFVQDGRVAQIGMQSEDESGNRALPRHSFQQMCNHFLGDRGCGVDLTRFTWEGMVTAINGNVLTVQDASLQPLRFRNGVVRPLGIDDVRSVIDQQGDLIRVLYPFASLAVGARVAITAGCNHLMNEDCALVFDNVPRFGGFPWIPTRNPFVRGL